MPVDMFLPEAFPLKLKITPDGDKFKCVMTGGDLGKSPPVYGKTAAEALGMVAAALLDRQMELDMVEEVAGLLGFDLKGEGKERAKEEAGSRE